MLSSPYMLQERWPRKEIYRTLKDYFENEKYLYQASDYLDFEFQEEVIERLATDCKFSKFWTIIQEQYPNKKEYLESLLNKGQHFDPEWIECTYKQYCKDIAFEKLTEQERHKLSEELSDLMKNTYQRALKGEALRLNCEVCDIEKTRPVLTLTPDHVEEFRLADLPYDVFVQILHRLDTLDVFRMNLVCKTWRSLLYDNVDRLERAEHALTFHLVTFSDWTVQSSLCLAFQNKPSLNDEYQLFSWSLVQWYCNISKGLESLILDHPVSYSSLAIILHLCPKLKNLQIGYNQDHNSYKRNPVDLCTSIVELPKLEFFYSPGAFGWCFREETIPRLNKDILFSSTKLKAFGGSLDERILSTNEIRSSLGKSFSQLIALDLTWFGPSVLEFLSNIKEGDHLQLKYMRLAYLEYRIDKPGAVTEGNARIALHKLLKQLGNLKILILFVPMEIANSIVPVLTECEANLEYLILDQIQYGDQEDLGGNSLPIDGHRLNPSSISSFQNRLQSKQQPGLDLSKFHFRFGEGEAVENFKTTFPAFTVLDSMHSFKSVSFQSKLNHPDMKRRLCIDF
eukprot:g7621.t1